MLLKAVGFVTCVVCGFVVVLACCAGAVVVQLHECALLSMCVLPCVSKRGSGPRALQSSQPKRQVLRDGTRSLLCALHTLLILCLPCIYRSYLVCFVCLLYSKQFTCELHPAEHPNSVHATPAIWLCSTV
jgi:hypothetical protein